MSARPDITPELTVTRLLEHYPALEEVLVGLAPAFAKLRNPVLRRTVARVTSLRQAAVVGGVPLATLVTTLRDAAGLAGPGAPIARGEEAAHGAASRPPWVTEFACAGVDDARADIEAGRMPLPRILAALAALAPGTLYEVVTPFPPAPLLSRLAEAGYRVHCEQRAPGEVVTSCTLAG
ncbi:MAG: DUF1858 domain-containing protein [Candidatus Krumholzibacteriia bacterium]